jgi:D-alanyl-lipoteichoic acid acyltransferase DltB (MBOAT superfamily)
VLFNTFAFAGLFLPLTLLAFWLAPGDRARRAVMLAASLFFYGYWFWPYLGLLVALVAVAWACALRAERSRSTAPVWAAAVILLGVLGFFKYAGFLATIAHDLGLSDTASRRVHTLALPIGISFIAFQALGYVVDVHRREFPAERRFSIVLLFKAFFPQLIAGPICRAHELMPQLKQHFRFDLQGFVHGLAIFAVGLLLKEVFADSLAPLVDGLYADGGRPDMLHAWTAAVGFGAQIYADFWGYSTMAVGLARMFGVDIPVNFRLPYLATSLRDFWRRWHITLSQWLRDYLYKPLGGSRHGQARMAWTLMVTMLLGGIWHGANYTFLVWGGIHGVVQVLEHLLRRREVPGAPAPSRLAAILGWGYVFVTVFVAWVFFRAQDLGQALTIVGAMFTGEVRWTADAGVRQILALSVALMVLQVPIEKLLEALRNGRVLPATATATAFTATLVAVVLGAPAAVPFIYFQF